MLREMGVDLDEACTSKFPATNGEKAYILLLGYFVNFASCIIFKIT